MRRLLVFSMLAGLLFLVAACGGAADQQDDRAADIVHRAVVAARSGGGSTVERFPGALPPGLPARPPLYSDADLVVSSRIIGPPPSADEAEQPEPEDAPQVVLYFIVLDSDDDRERVFGFYEDALDEAPWQLNAAASTAEFDFLEFSKRDDLDISGRVQVVAGEEGQGTSVFISLQDAGAVVEERPPFEPDAQVPMLSRFPEDLAEYPDAILTDTGFFRTEQGESFLLVFITTDSAEAVTAFYQEQFTELGWTALEREPVDSEHRLHFEDEPHTIDGELTIARLARDARYTEAQIRVQVSTPQEPANGDGTATAEAPTGG